MRLLDLFCGAGGAAMGYHRAGFDEIVGVDIEPQPNYPFELIQDDALAVLWLVADDGGRGFDAIHASPPCQGYANVTRWRGSHDDHPQLIAPTRERLKATGLPYVIENVRTTELLPCVVLCGSMFGLPIRRHRGFETSWGMSPMVLACHHRPSDMAFMHKYERAYADAMGCDWMTSREAREAIPPAYTQHIGRYLKAAIKRKDEPVPSEMPYKRNGCDLCGRVAPLSRIELAAGNREKLARVAYICDQHREVWHLETPAPPLSPQAESLF